MTLLDLQNRSQVTDGRAETRPNTQEGGSFSRSDLCRQQERAVPRRPRSSTCFSRPRNVGGRLQLCADAQRSWEFVKASARRLESEDSDQREAFRFLAGEI